MILKDKLREKFEEEYGRLNELQRRAVDQVEGPVMVIAGPGTGKTQILSARIGKILLSDAQVEPHNILCLTYTDAGVVAMRRRLLQFIGPDAYRVGIYTFHAFCHDVIQENLPLPLLPHSPPLYFVPRTLSLPPLFTTQKQTIWHTP